MAEPVLTHIENPSRARALSFHAMFLNNRFAVGALIFLTALALLFATLEDPGITQDEPYVNRKAAVSFVTWLETALADMARGDWGHFTSRETLQEYFKDDYTFHPPFARFLAGITWRLFHEPLGEIRALRLAPALLFSVATVLLYVLVGEYYGISAGALASLLLLLCPAPFGHAHLIALDSPIASLWLMTVFCFVKGLDSRRWALAFGISAALAMNTKIHGFAVPAPLFLWGLLFHRKKIVPNLLAFLAVTPVALYLTNPLYWHHPFADLYYFVRAMLKKRAYEPVGTHFLGDRYDFSPPKYYAFFMTLISIPPATLLLGLWGAAWSGREVRQFLDGKKPGQLSVLFILNALTALGLTVFDRIPIYDGVRLFLPAFYFSAGLAGIGFYGLTRTFATGRFKAILSGGVFALAVGASAFSLARIHPFELSYFNAFVGGLPGANRIGLESTYWNDAFTIESAKYMNENYPGASFSKSIGLRYTFKYYKELGILDKSIVQRESGYDYYLLQHRQGWFKKEDWFYSRYMRPEYSVGREGVPLFEIYKSLGRLKKERGDLRDRGSERLSKKGYEWRRYLIAPVSGTYKLGVLVNYDLDLWIDKRQRNNIKSTLQSPPREYEVHLDAGVHTIDLLFPYAVRPADFYLAWRTPDGKRGLIPKESLAPAEMDQ